MSTFFDIFIKKNTRIKHLGKKIFEKGLRKHISKFKNTDFFQFLRILANSQLFFCLKIPCPPYLQNFYINTLNNVLFCIFNKIGLSKFYYEFEAQKKINWWNKLIIFLYNFIEKVIFKNYVILPAYSFIYLCKKMLKIS